MQHPAYSGIASAAMPCPHRESIWHAERGLNDVDHRVALGPGNRRHRPNAEHRRRMDLTEHAKAVPSAAGVAQRRRGACWSLGYAAARS